MYVIIIDVLQKTGKKTEETISGRAVIMVVVKTTCGTPVHPQLPIARVGVSIYRTLQQWQRNSNRIRLP